MIAGKNETQGRRVYSTIWGVTSLKLLIIKNGSFRLHAEPVQIDSITFEQGTGSDSHVRILDSSHCPVFEAWESQAWDYAHGGRAHHVLPRWQKFFEAEGMHDGDAIIIAYRLIEKPAAEPAKSERRPRPGRGDNDEVPRRAA